MRGVLEKVVTDELGTGHQNAASKFYTTAGKTSTGYYPEDPEHHLLGGGTALAGFVGFAPVKNPRVVVYIGTIMPHGKQAHGSSQSGPVFREIAEKVLQHWKVAPDQK
jgi:penicillin-binding protein 2B